jgi:vacuolar-type H+-ATPase subunit C/Vma6
MEFLQEIEDRGYPADYLLARIHGRRLFLLRDWDRALAGPDISGYLMSTHYRGFMTAHLSEDIWKRFLRESAWVYYQMNNELRNIFQPYYMYSELNTLLTCLRYKAGKGNIAEIKRVLEFSLISGKIKGLLERDTDILPVLYMLEKKPAFIPGKPAGLEKVFLKDGLSGVEQKITKALLEYIIDSDAHPVIKRYFTFIADTKNIITLLKHLRWETTADPVFGAEGNIKKTTLYKILRSYNTDALAGLVYKQTGLRLEGLDAVSAENALHKRLAGKIKKWERESPDIGLLLHYLWRCAAEAKNLSIIYYGRDIDKNILKEELVH